MATATGSSKRPGDDTCPASNSQSESDRRMAMRQKAPEIRIQEPATGDPDQPQGIKGRGKLEQHRDCLEIAMWVNHVQHSN